MHRFLPDLLNSLVLLQKRSNFLSRFGAQLQHIARQNLLIAALISQHSRLEHILVPLTLDASYFFIVVRISLDYYVHTWTVFFIVFHGTPIYVFLFGQMGRSGVALVFGYFSHPTVYHFRRFLFVPFFDNIGKYGLFIVFAIFYHQLALDLFALLKLFPIDDNSRTDLSVPHPQKSAILSLTVTVNRHLNIRNLPFRFHNTDSLGASLSVGREMSRSNFLHIFSIRCDIIPFPLLIPLHPPQKQSSISHQTKSFLLHHLGSSLGESCMQRFLGSFLEPALLKLNLFGQSTSLHVGEQERLDEVFDEGFVVVVSSFESFEMLVHFLFAEVGHDAGLSVRCSFDCVADDPVEVTINRTLVHLDNLLVKTLLSGPDNLLGISSTSLLHFSVSSFIFSLFHFLLDLLFLSYSHQFLAEFVQSFSYYFTLKTLVHGISEPILMFLQQPLFSFLLIKIWNFGHNEQLFNQGQSFFFPLVHDILLCPASQNSLQEHDSHLSFN